MKKHTEITDILAKGRTQAEESNTADFVSSVSHDLRNPLTSIKAYAELAKKRVHENGDETTALFIKKIEEQSDRASHLITELLEISRITGGKIVMHKKPFRLDTLVKETVEDFQVAVKTHTFTVSGTIDKKVIADKERIRRILLNLLTNAVKYSPKADKVIVRMHEDKKNAIVSIQDFGDGIPLSKQKHLFDRYFRVKEGEIKGYGLGLPIVKRIVDAHDGKVWFESKKDRGSLFSFSLPLSK